MDEFTLYTQEGKLKKKVWAAPLFEKKRTRRVEKLMKNLLSFSVTKEKKNKKEQQQLKTT